MFCSERGQLTSSIPYLKSDFPRHSDLFPAKEYSTSKSIVSRFFVGRLRKKAGVPTVPRVCWYSGREYKDRLYTNTKTVLAFTPRVVHVFGVTRG